MSVKTLLLPPGGLLLLAAAGLLLSRWRRRTGLAVAALALLLLYLLATPVVGGALLRLHETFPALREVPPEAAVIVVLGAEILRDTPEYGGVAVGSLTLQRLQYTARLHHETGLPVLTAGGPMSGQRRSTAALMAETLERDFRVTVRWREERSNSTADNARAVAALLRAQGVRHGLLVTHAWHMPRAAAAFRRAGLPLQPAPTRFTPAAVVRPDSLLPSTTSLAHSYYASHEAVGRLWYSLRRLPRPLEGGSGASP